MQGRAFCPRCHPCCRSLSAFGLSKSSTGDQSRSYLASPFFGAGSGVLLGCSQPGNAFSRGASSLSASSQPACPFIAQCFWLSMRKAGLMRLARLSEWCGISAAPSRSLNPGDYTSPCNVCQRSELPVPKDSIPFSFRNRIDGKWVMSM